MNNQQEKTMLPVATRVLLKKMAHHLKPVVQIGKNGITDSLIQEINSALTSHELIKIKLPKQCQTQEEFLQKILSETESMHIDTIGNIVILFRKRDADSLF